MPMRCPTVDNCCVCITDLKVASAIIATLAIVTSPVLSWCMVRHSYVIRVSCTMSTKNTKQDVINYNLNNVLSFGFGANAGLEPSCLSPGGAGGSADAVATPAPSVPKGRSGSKSEPSEPRALDLRKERGIPLDPPGARRERAPANDKPSETLKESDKAPETLRKRVRKLVKKQPAAVDKDKSLPEVRPRRSDSDLKKIYPEYNEKLKAAGPMSSYEMFSSATAESGVVTVAKYIGWLVVLGDIAFIFTSAAFLAGLYRPLAIRPSKVAQLFFISGIVSTLFSFAYGLLYVVACSIQGGNFPLCELVLILSDFGIWIYFLMVVNSYRNLLSAPMSIQVQSRAQR